MTATPLPAPTSRTLDPLSSIILAIAGGILVGRSDRLSRSGRAAATVGGLALIGAAARGPLLATVRRSGTERRSASVRLSLVVEQPVEVVFAFVRDFENF